jgi:hypothetical protein
MCADRVSLSCLHMYMRNVLFNYYSLEETCLPFMTEELSSYIILYGFS